MAISLRPRMAYSVGLLKIMVLLHSAVAIIHLSAGAGQPPNRCDKRASSRLRLRHRGLLPFVSCATRSLMAETVAPWMDRSIGSAQAVTVVMAGRCWKRSQLSSQGL